MGNPKNIPTKLLTAQSTFNNKIYESLNVEQRGGDPLLGGLASLMELTVPLGLLLVNEHMKKRLPQTKTQKGGSASKSKSATKPASATKSKSVTKTQKVE